MVICARNAENGIRERLGNLIAQQDVPAAYDIVVVSDGSTDRTAAFAHEFQPRVTVHEITEHVGKAEALNQGILRAHGEVVVLGDVRQAFAPDAIRHLLESFRDPAVGAVSGELFLERDGSTRTEGVGLYWELEKWMRKKESQLHSTCGCTGAIYAIRRALFRPLKPGTVLDDVAIPMQIVFQGKRVTFNGGAVALDRIAEDFVEENRRKVRTLAGNLQLCRFYPELLNPFRNPIWFQFVSHKLLRLVCPWLLLLLLVVSACNWLLTLHPVAAVLLGLQVAFYGLALLGSVWPGRHLPISISAPLAFTALNWYAACAWFVFFGRTEIGKWKDGK
jgi:cellulose synthase/poly-beta-1,6-N-acetylglucosamine synthase-like glycosyltransferase